MNKQLYNQSDYPGPSEKDGMWKNIQDSLPEKKETNIHLHWKSFWMGNAAAVVLIFALVGIYQTGKGLFEPDRSSADQMYQTLNAATQQLEQVAPVLISQASEQNKNSMQSTLSAIKEIDRLINELKNEMLINGITPSKQSNLKRLYATKLDFYKELLLTNEESL